MRRELVLVPAIRSDRIRLDSNTGDNSPIAATYILIQNSHKALPTSRLEKVGDREHDSVEHSIGKCDIPVAEFLLLGLKIL